ncbi:MAG TPA: hypothetical protein PKO06_19945, partial [Candidatus Ozemobacteraceae bacterium]|nr:hypothetical protein [Candidatus Ozemobacteraceae bacterium]
EPIIEVKKAEIQEWNSGRDFRVSYLVKCGWLTSEAQDQLMVWIHQKEDAYRHVALPRDTWFTMADLKLAVSKRVFNTQLGRVDAKAKPFFASLDEAREFIKKKYGLVSITRDEVRYYVPGKLPRTDGAPYLCWWATIDDAANRGRQGHLNLITGTDESYENAIRHYAEPDNDASPVPTRATPTAIPHRKGE